MAQGITAKGKTPSGQNVELRVDEQGNLFSASPGLAPVEFTSWEVVPDTDTTDLIKYYKGATLVRTLLITYVDDSKASVVSAEVQP